MDFESHIKGAVIDPECARKSGGLWCVSVLLLPLTTHIWSRSPRRGHHRSHFITFFIVCLYNESSFSYYGGMMWWMVSTVGVIINPLREYLQSWFSAFPPLPNFLPLSRHPLALAAPLSLMMGVFLFCGGCELSEFVFVSIIPSASAPAYKSGRGAWCILTWHQSVLW